MKKVILAFMVILATSISTANDDLAASMKVIGEQFKVLAGAIQSKNFTENELVAIETMQAAISEAALVYPDEATDEAAKEQYSRWMAELMNLAITMETEAEIALGQDPQDLSGVIQTLMAMNELRKEAHFVFRPE